MNSSAKNAIETVTGIFRSLISILKNAFVENCGFLLNSLVKEPNKGGCSLLKFYKFLVPPFFCAPQM